MTITELELSAYAICVSDTWSQMYSYGVCHVRKRRVSCIAAEPSLLRHYVTMSIIRLCYYLVVKIYHVSNFRRCRPPTKYF